MPKKLPEIDLFSFLPIRYEDRRTPVLSDGFSLYKKVLSAGHPVSVEIQTAEKGKALIVDMKDAAGFFKVKFLKYTNFHLSVFRQTGRTIYLYGKPKLEGGEWVFYHPEFPDEVGSIIPVYRHISGISPKRLRLHIRDAVNTLTETIEDEISVESLKAMGLSSIGDALRSIHCSTDGLPDDKHFKRLAYRKIADKGAIVEHSLKNLITG
jgi:RecG-like helicase